MAPEKNTGFLGRWSRRKTQALQSQPVAQPRLPVQDVVALPATGTAIQAVDAPDPAALTGAKAPAAVLSLEDALSLTRESDFTPFMAPGVELGVRNAAMKKLFADPHFNVMDGLDLYMGDYSKSDPIPEAMLRQMTGAKFLGLFDEEKKAEAPLPAVGEQASGADLQAVAESSVIPNTLGPAVAAGPSDPSPLEPAHPMPAAGNVQEDHANIDLRLQPDHAAPASGAGRGT